MNQISRILVPVDLSDESVSAVGLATNLAKCNGAELIFCYVGLPPLPQEASFHQGDLTALIAREHEQFRKVTPKDPTVPYNHTFVRGNPGPEIVRLADSKNCDLIVMATHGRSGILRFVLGSVAEYVIRNSEIPVVSVKIPKTAIEESEKDQPLESQEPNSNPVSPFVTSVMTHSLPIHDFDEMEKVISEFKAANCTAAPVVDGLGKCIGILTATDISHYRNVAQRLKSKDQSVLDEVYDTSKYGLRILDRNAFHRVKKHMTSPVVTIENDATCSDAEAKFAENVGIHHLIVVDENNKPIGIVEQQQLPTQWNFNESVPV